MGLRDILSGRKKLAEPKDDRLFALTTATVTLDTELGLKPAGVGAVTFKPLSSGDFDRADSDMEELIRTAAKSAGSEIDRKTDEFGFEWLIVKDSDFEDLVTTAYTIASELTAQGFGGQLLAAAFRFEHTGSFDAAGNPVYWIYGFKQGTFWPFIPSGEHERDNAGELELKAKLEKELPIEPDLTRWMALFDAPL
jgi:hypothetical protein